MQAPPSSEERRNVAARSDLFRATARHLIASAGLTVTAPQAIRLCGVPSELGHRLLEELLEAGVLSRTTERAYTTADNYRGTSPVDAFTVARDLAALEPVEVRASSSR